MFILVRCIGLCIGHNAFHCVAVCCVLTSIDAHCSNTIIIVMLLQHVGMNGSALPRTSDIDMQIEMCSILFLKVMIGDEMWVWVDHEFLDTANQCAIHSYSNQLPIMLQ